MTIVFSTFHLVVDNKSPDINTLRPLFSLANDEFSNSNNEHYLITGENINNKYCWLYAKYGKDLPYSFTVFNIGSHKEEANPRTTVQVETSKQLFGMYSFQEKVLYLSNGQKKSFFEKYLAKQLRKRVIIKSFIKNVDDFLATLKNVKKLKFITKPDLFTANSAVGDIVQPLEDLLGLDMDAKVTLELAYPKVPLTEKFKKYFKKMVGWKQAGSTASLICIGEDDKNFETIFNVDSFIKKINIPAKKDPQGMYDAEMIKSELIKEMERGYDPDS